MSDIREGTDDDKIVRDQECNANWHKIIQPDFSYLKFRCPYDNPIIYKYYKGDIYLQLYAPTSSTETRILFTKNLEPYEYNSQEYQGKMLYFNRIIRPSYHKSLIKNNFYFDHCYDCTYFGYIIKNYIKKFKLVSPFQKLNKNKTTIYDIMKYITKYISKYSQDKISIHNKYVRTNIL